MYHFLVFLYIFYWAYMITEMVTKIIWLLKSISYNMLKPYNIFNFITEYQLSKLCIKWTYPKLSILKIKTPVALEHTRLCVRKLIVRCKLCQNFHLKFSGTTIGIWNSEHVKALKTYHCTYLLYDTYFTYNMSKCYETLWFYIWWTLMIYIVL